MSTMTHVRLLTGADLPACLRLKDAGRWNQTSADWQNLLALAPDGCFGTHCDAELRATTRRFDVLSRVPGQNLAE